MSREANLLDFLFEFIDIQIKKYKSLGTIGVGPDAGMSAQLVHNEVTELFLHLQNLLSLLENSSNLSNNEKDDQFTNIFNQLYFFVKQEYLRAHAGWLIDSNVIHNTVYARLKKQIPELEGIAKAANIDIDTANEAKTLTQKQCEHDSNEIAFKILHKAVELKKTPDMKLSDQIPEHAQIIFRSHAKPNGRFYKEDIWNSIEELHEKCNAFLSNSMLQRNDTSLSKENAIKFSKNHRITFDGYLAHYQSINPTSKLFSPNHDWYKVGDSPHDPKPNHSIYMPQMSKQTLLFSGVLSAAMIMCSLIYYICHDQTDIFLASNRNNSL